MASVNRVHLLGNLGRDPEVKHTASGMAVCNLAIATSYTRKDKQSGEKVEETEWHRCVLYDRLAEIAGEYLKKGRPVYIEGRLKTRKWTDKDGKDQYTTEIVGESMQLLGGRDDAPAERSPQPKSPPATRAPNVAQKTGFDDMDDDIPFWP